MPLTLRAALSDLLHFLLVLGVMVVMGAMVSPTGSGLLLGRDSAPAL